MKRAYLRWVLYGVFLAISVYFYYRSNHKARLLEQLRLRMVTLASPVVAGPDDGKPAETYLSFQLREYPDVEFKISELRYELLDKEFATALSVRDTIEVWIKDNPDLSGPRPSEKEVYGIYSGQAVFLDLDQVLKAEKRAKLPGNILLLLFLLALVLGDYFEGPLKKANQ